MNTVRVAISGFGNVGRNIAELIDSRQEYFTEKFGTRVVLTGVCGSSQGLIDAEGLTESQWSDRAGFHPGLTGEEFLKQVRADVLIEAGPSNYSTGLPGLTYMEQALSRGLHVVAVSKGALVVDGPRLAGAGARQGVQLFMSGASASALPTIDFMTYDLAGTRIKRVEAVLTGTTTFILDTMISCGSTFDEALAQAQERGIAEPEPSFDIDGWDTAAKTVIIAQAVFGKTLKLSELHRDSLSSVTPEQLSAWQAEGLTPRLIGSIDTEGNEITAGVQLKLYPTHHAFALTKGSTKALYVETSDLGEFTMLGGASNPTATAAAALKDLDHILAGGI